MLREHILPLDDRVRPLDELLVPDELCIVQCGLFAVVCDTIGSCRHPHLGQLLPKWRTQGGHRC
jgi:hypothetical protein